MFCSKCGKEIGNSERFCPYCGTPAGAAAPAPGSEPAYKAPSVSLDKRIMTGIKNLGVNTKLYMGLLAAVVLSWILVNTPVFALKLGMFEFYGGSISLGFTQLATANLGGEGFAIACSIICNLAIIGGLVMLVLPIFLNAKASVAGALVALCTSGVSLLLVLIEWIVIAVDSGMFVWISMAGFWYIIAAIASIVLSVFLMLEVNKKVAHANYYPGGNPGMYR